MIRARIIGTGHYLPEKILTNKQLEAFVDTSDEWIRQRTGICQRHMAAPNEKVSDMGAAAAKMALENAGVSPEEIDYVLLATLTPDSCMPSAACRLQYKTGATRAAAVDINAACSGFVYALQMADSFIRTGVHKTVLVVGAENLTALINWDQRDTAVLFGDGAGAVVLRAEEGKRGILTTYTGADGSACDILHVPGGQVMIPLTQEHMDELNLGIVMDGRELYKRAVRAFGEAIEVVLKQAGLTAEDLDIFIPHQANVRIIDSAAQRLGLPNEKVFLNLDKVGNTSAASIPIALSEAVAEGRVKEGDIVLFAGFGAGLTWGSTVVRW